MSKVTTTWKDVKNYLDTHELKREQKIDLLNLINKHINAFPIDDIIQITQSGLILANGKVLNLEQREAFIISAKSILSNTAFNMIADQVVYKAMKKGLHDARDIDDVYFTKVAMYFIDLFKNYLIQLDKLA